MASKRRNAWEKASRREALAHASRAALLAEGGHELDYGFEHPLNVFKVEKKWIGRATYELWRSEAPTATLHSTLRALGG